MKRKLWIAWPFLLSEKIFTIRVSLLRQPDLQFVLLAQLRLAGFLYKSILNNIILFKAAFYILQSCTKVYFISHILYIHNFDAIRLKRELYPKYFIIHTNIDLYLKHPENTNLR